MRGSPAAQNRVHRSVPGCSSFTETKDGIPMMTRSPKVSLFSSAARFSVLLVAGSLSVVGAQAPAPVAPLPDQASFLQETRSALQNGRQLQSQYTHREKRTEVRVGDEGEVIGKSVKVFDVYPTPAGADAYRRLISVNGIPVDREKLEQTDRERRNALLECSRQLERETPSQREQRLRSEAESRRKENETIDDAFRLYDFRIIGRERIDGYDAILVTFSPAQGVTPRTTEGKLLQKFSGRAWVAESDHQLIRFEGESIDDVSMGFGLLARLYKGSHVVFQRRKVSEGVWLPSELRYSGGGRVLLVRKLRVEGIREYSDYRALSEDPFFTPSPSHSGK
jgi:hypothetical protein